MDIDNKKKRTKDQDSGQSDKKRRTIKDDEYDPWLQQWIAYCKSKGEKDEGIEMVLLEDLQEAALQQEEAAKKQKEAHTGDQPFVFQPPPGLYPLTPEQHQQHWNQYEQWYWDKHKKIILYEAEEDWTGQQIALSDEELQALNTGKDLTFTPLHLASSVVKPGGDTAVTITTVDTPKTLRFHFLDVGQGNGTLIECPHGELILFDFGTAKNKSKTKGPVMDFINSKGAKLDYLLVSHADKDHVNMLPLLEGFTFGKVICGGKAEHYEAKDGKKLVELLEKKKIDLDDCLINDGEPFSEAPNLLKASRKIQCKDVDIFIAAVNSPTAELEDIRKLRPVSEQHKAETIAGTPTNASSMVLVIRYGGKQVFLSADATFSTDYFLLRSETCKAWRGQLKSYAMSGGHHGAKFSFSEELLKAIDPEWVHFSADLHQGFKHPTWLVIDRVFNNCLKVNGSGPNGPAYGPHGVVIGEPDDVDEKGLLPLKEAFQTLRGLKNELTKHFPKAGVTWKHAIFWFALMFLRKQGEQREKSQEVSQPEGEWLQSVIGEVAWQLLIQPGNNELELLAIPDKVKLERVEYWAKRFEDLSAEEQRLEAAQYDTQWHWFTTEANLFTAMETGNLGVYWVLEIDANGNVFTCRT